jgi:hypothetical protein
MSRFIIAVVSFALVTINVAFWPGGLFAQEVGKTKELSPGRVRKNLGEVPANVPGFEKVRIVEDTAKPGAAWKTPEGGMPAPMFCTLTKGEITVVEKGGTKKVYKVGDSWVCPVGLVTEAKSTGSEPSVMRMHHLLKAGDK